MKKRLLVVVDMVNGFIYHGALADIRIEKIVPSIIKNINYQIKTKGDILTFCDSHTEDDEEFNVFPVHCLEDSEESELIPQLAPYKAYMTIIKKNTTNGFNEIETQEFFKKNQYKEVVVVGCCTDICVENFVMSLKSFFDTNNIATKIIVPENSVSTYDGEGHEANICQMNSLDRMKNAGILTIVYQNEEEQDN